MASLEVCCFNSTSAFTANQARASRIELCGDAFDGGSTPNWNSFYQLRFVGKITAPIYVMIRPRGGDFNYSETEFQEMLNNVEKFRNDRNTRADGFVFGILNSRNKVDVDKNKKLVELASPLPCTFHKAFDEIATEDMAQALEDIIMCGFQNILTSGGKKTAADGVETLKRLVNQARGRINVMPGGGVRSENINLLMRETGAKWFHSSTLVNGQTEANKEEIRMILEVLNG